MASTYVDSATGATVIQWTTGPAKNQHLYFTSPSVTEDDRWLTFISDRTGDPNLFAIDRRDGSIRQLSRNTAGLLRGYVYPQGGRTGLAKASPCLDAKHNRLFYIRNDAVYVVDLDEPEPADRKACELPANSYTAFTHISPDGQTLCVPIVDARAFDEPMQTQWEQLRRVPTIMQSAGYTTGIWLIDTATGRMQLAADVPFWVTHVQFDPSGSGRIVFNKEGQWPTTGVPLPDRVWCLEPGGAFRPLAPEADGEWRSHENWSPDGNSVVYHGSLHGKPFVASRAWDGELLHQASLEGLTLYHATAAVDGRHLFIDKPDGYIALVDPTGGRLQSTNICRHDSSCRDQDAHVHPVTSSHGKSVVFTSDRTGECNVYEVLLAESSGP